MEAFGIQLEANIHVLEFSVEEEFKYKEIQVIKENDKKINFSVFVSIKQSRYVEDRYLEIALIRILGNTTEPLSSKKLSKKQTINKMSLGRIELFGLEDDVIVADDPPIRLLGDKWHEKQLVKWNFKNVPTDGPGHYAIVAAIPADEDPANQDILDCSYFEII